MPQGPKGERRPRDVIGNAVHVMRIARVQSSRRLEREAGRNVEVMWLTGRVVPDHKTIADFRKDNGRAKRPDPQDGRRPDRFRISKRKGSRLPFRPLARLAQDEERDAPAMRREAEEEWGKKKRR